MYTYMSNYNYLCYTFTYNHMSIYICLYVHLYEYLDTFIQVIMFICVLNELSKI